MSGGKLYVIGTPIGNLLDITLRALQVLETLDVLVCEDSRVTAHLINHYREVGKLTNKPRYFVCNEFNEYAVTPQIVEMVQRGQRVGFVSDAGMPTLSDPGFRAIRAVLDAELPLEVVPGVSSLTTAISCAGVGGEYMLYLGFLPKKSGKRLAVLESVRDVLAKMESIRIVLFVSPHRLDKELQEIHSTVGDVHAVILRELTKKFEERIEGTVAELADRYEKVKAKGEMVLVLGKS